MPIPAENSHFVPLLREHSALPVTAGAMCRIPLQSRGLPTRPLTEELLSRFPLREYSFSHSPTTGVFLLSASTRFPLSAALCLCPLCPCSPLRRPRLCPLCPCSPLRRPRLFPLCPCSPLRRPRLFLLPSFFLPHSPSPSPHHLLSGFLLPVSLFPHVLLCSLFLALPWLSVPHHGGF